MIMPVIEAKPVPLCCFVNYRNGNLLSLSDIHLAARGEKDNTILN